MQRRARADRRVRAVGGSAHHGTGHRKKSLGLVELTLEQKRAVIAMVAEEYKVERGVRGRRLRAQQLLSPANAHARCWLAAGH